MKYSKKKPKSITLELDKANNQKGRAQEKGWESETHLFMHPEIPCKP